MGGEESNGFLKCFWTLGENEPRKTNGMELTLILFLLWSVPKNYKWKPQSTLYKVFYSE